MCNCGKPQKKCTCTHEKPKYNWYDVDNYNCNPCNDKPVCKKTIPAQCVINYEDLDFLGAGAGDKVNVQTLLISINNALKSISNIECITYTRTIDPETGIANYVHSIDWECVASQVCPLCAEEPCDCPVPLNLDVVFDGRDMGNPYLYRATITWDAVPGATSYSVEYKLSSSPTWSILPPTPANFLIIDLTESNTLDYDFRVKANCPGCSSSYATFSTEAQRCLPPTRVEWDDDTNVLEWETDAAFPTANFILSYRKIGVATWTNVVVPITEFLPGRYRANFASIPLDANNVYQFSVVKLCGNTYSDRGNGCGFQCATVDQSIPTVTDITTTTATVSWPAIIGAASGYTIAVFNVTDSTVHTPETSIGLVTSYNLVGLLPEKTYRVTIRYRCTDDSLNCEGQDATFATLGPPPPEFDYYIADRHICNEITGGCDLVEADIEVHVPAGTPIVLGNFYMNGTNPEFYEIVGTTTETVGSTLLIYTDVYTNCDDFCPDPDPCVQPLPVTGQCVNCEP